MSVQSHVEHLKRRHRALDVNITQEEQHHSTDHLEIASLKREKLKLKEEIERLTATLH